MNHKAVGDGNSAPNFRRNPTLEIRKDAVAIVAVAGLFLFIALIGFTPRYFQPLFSGGYVSPSGWMHAHVISSLLWLVLFLVQPLLILRRKLDRHRLVGRFALGTCQPVSDTHFKINVDSRAV